MPGPCCSAPPTGRSGWSSGLPAASPITARPELVEHTVATLVGQRVFGIALGYEDLIDHDQLRHDPVMAVLGGKLAAAARIARRWPANRRSTGWS